MLALLKLAAHAYPIKTQMKHLGYLVFCLALASCSSTKDLSFDEQIMETLKDSVLIHAQEYLKAPIETVTATSSPRSAGGLHDFFSEGDYWWPDTANPKGPYVQKDGMTNPANFTAHRTALMQFSEAVGNLTTAYLITKDAAYAQAALKHCKAWFIQESTKMNPNFLYAQAITGRHSGRGIGIIDGVHLMEVVQSLMVLESYSMVEESNMEAFRTWFSRFVSWLSTHEYGKAEMVHPNNHSTCWNMQVGLYAVFTKNDSLISFCRDNYKNTLLPNQMASDGSFPKERERTKPYGYSLFNLDAMLMNCLILSDASNNLWEYTAVNGQNIELGLAYMKPYVEDKSTWDLTSDVMYWDNWPVAQPAYVFGAKKFNKPDYLELWKSKSHFPAVFEVKRNLPIRNPLIWLSEIN